MLNTLVRIAILAATLFVAACGTIATPVWSEQAEETRVALAVTNEYMTSVAPTPLPTATPRPTETPIPSPTPIPTATPTPEPTATSTAAPTTPPVIAAGGGDPFVYDGPGDVAAGDALFHEMRAEVNFACSTCHYVDQDIQLIGPGLLNVVERVEGHGTGETPQEYILHSIIEPSAYVVEGYPDALMPQVYATIFTEQQIEDLVAYVMSLRN